MINIASSNKNLVIPLMGVNGIHLTNTTLKNNLTDSTIQFNTLAKLVDKFNPDGIFAFMDLTVEAESLGMKIRFDDNESPSVEEHSIDSIEKLNTLRNNWNGISNRMYVFIDVVKQMAKNFSLIKGVHVIGPYTLAGELMGVNELTMNTLLEPDLVHEFLDFSVEVISCYVNELFSAGADVVSVLEPTAMMVSPAQYEEFSLVPFQKISQNINNQPLILHICGNTTHLIEKMATSGAVGLSLDRQVDMLDTIKKIPENMALIGNVNPINFIEPSNINIIEKETKELKDNMKGYKNFIFSTGCDLPIMTADENLEMFMNIAKS